MLGKKEVKENLKSLYMRGLRPIIRYSGDDIRERDRTEVHGIVQSVKAVYGEDKGKELLHKWCEQAEKEYSK